MKNAVLSLVCLLPASLHGQTRYPYIDSVFPPVVTRGRAVELEVSATGSLKTAYRVLVEGEGIAAGVEKRPEKLSESRALVKLEVSSDAAPGPREIRLATEEAITTLARFHVTDLPAVAEASSHGGLLEAQEITIPGVVNGRISGNVEVDWYRFQARKGERVSFTVLGARLQETIHHIGRFTPHFDAYLALSDAEGRELAANDDRFFADPLLSFEVPQDGLYHLALREANFKGHASYTYGLIATRGPFAAATLPLAVPPGKAAPVELVGPGLGPGDRAEVLLPDAALPGRSYLVRPRRADGGEAGEVWVAASELPPVLEAEPAAGRANDRPEDAQAISVPAGIAGRIGSPDDADCFAFNAVKGTSYLFQVLARRLTSPLDSELALLDLQGKVLAQNDDSRDLAGHTVKDSLLSWTAPSDGSFVLRIRDLNQRGGADFVYHLECGVAEPDFELTSDPDLSMVGQGNRSPVYVRAHRRGYDGPIEVQVEGLPPGVKVSAPPILPGMTDACLVLEAATDAPLGASSPRILGKARVKRQGQSEVELVRRAAPLAEIYQAQRVPARTWGVAVTRPSDIAVLTTVSELVLKPGESKEIPVRLQRGPQYRSGPVTLWGMWRFEGSIFGSSLPPGVSVNEKESRTGLNGEAVEGRIVLSAAPDAKPWTRVQTVAIGLVPIEFSVFVPYCTPPVLVTVTGKDGAVAAAP